jgi:hypothetical protein
MSELHAGGRTMEKFMLVRLKAHDPKKGLVLKQYTYRSIRFQAGRGWYKVDGDIAAYLENVHSVPGNLDAPLAFDVRTPDEARIMDENDRKAARQVLPADEPLDMTHVLDEYPRANRQLSTARNDVPSQRRSRARSSEDEQLDAREDEASEDEALLRRARRLRHQAVSWRGPRVDEFEDFNSLDEDDAEGAELDGQGTARRRHAYGFDDVPVRRSRPRIDEFDDADEAPPSPRRQRSLPDQSREKQTRYPQRYVIEHDELDHGHGQTRHVRGARQAKALNALWNREARRMRRQHNIENQYKEVPTRCTREGAIERQLDDGPIEKPRRSPSQTDQQHALQARHARQMAVTLAGSEALDDAMSHGDAEDSLPGSTARDRHSSHGDAEDSLPIKTTRDRHSSHGDAEDSLPTGSSHMSHGDAEDSLPGSTARDRHSCHGDAEDSLPRSRQSAMHGTCTRHGDAEDSLPHCDRRMQHQNAPSLRHQRDPREAPDAVDDDCGGRNAEEPSHSEARGQRAQQPPSSAAHDELDALDDVLDDRLEKASEDQRPGFAQQQAGTSLQCHPQGDHASGVASRDERQLYHGDLLVNCDARNQVPIPRQEASNREASGSEHEIVVQREPRKPRRTYARMRNTHPRDHPDALAAAPPGDSDEERARPPQRSPPENGGQCQLTLPSIEG